MEAVINKINDGFNFEQSMKPEGLFHICIGAVIKVGDAFTDTVIGIINDIIYTETDEIGIHELKEAVNEGKVEIEYPTYTCQCCGKTHHKVNQEDLCRYCFNRVTNPVCDDTDVLTYRNKRR
jgi:hypothetical protein